MQDEPKLQKIYNKHAKSNLYDYNEVYVIVTYIVAIIQLQEKHNEIVQQE